MMIKEIVQLCFALLLSLLLAACGGGGGETSVDGGQLVDDVIPVDEGTLDNDGDGIINSVDVDADGNGLIEIATLEKLDWMRNDLAGTSVNDGSGGVNSDGCPESGCNGYELTIDLNFDTNEDGAMNTGDDYYSAGKGWLPIGSEVTPFTAHFDGNGYRIKNLYINRSSGDTQTDGGKHIGLFGMIDGGVSTEGAQIHNLVLDGPLASVTGDYLVGTMAGWVDGNVTISNVHVRGKVASASSFAGGVIGSFNYDGSPPVTVCGICGIDSSSFIGDVSASIYSAGGLAGITFHTEISDSFATGKVMARGNAGGLVGDANLGTMIKRSFAANTVGAVLAAGALVGRSGTTTYEDNYFVNDADEYLTRAVGWNATPVGDLDPVGTQGKSLNQLQTATTLTGWGNQWEYGSSIQLPGLTDGVSVHRGNEAGARPGEADCSKVAIVNVAPIHRFYPGSCTHDGDDNATADCVESRLSEVVGNVCVATAKAFDVYVPGTGQEDGQWGIFNHMFSRDNGRLHISLQYSEKPSLLDEGFYGLSVDFGTESLNRLLNALKARFPGTDIRVFGHSKGSHVVAKSSESHSDVQFFAFGQAGATEAHLRGAPGYIEKKQDNLVTLTWANDEVKDYLGGLSVPNSWHLPGTILNPTKKTTSPFWVRIDHHKSYGGRFTDGLPGNDPLAGEGGTSKVHPYCATGSDWFWTSSKPGCESRQESFLPYLWGNADCRNRAFAMMEHGVTSSDKHYIGYSGPRTFGCTDRVGMVYADYTLDYKLHPGDEGDCKAQLELTFRGIGSSRQNGGKITLSSTTQTGVARKNGKIWVPLHMDFLMKGSLTQVPGKWTCGGFLSAGSKVVVEQLIISFNHPDTGERVSNFAIIGNDEGTGLVPLDGVITGTDNQGWKEWKSSQYVEDGYEWKLRASGSGVKMNGGTDDGREAHAYKWVHLLD